MSDGVTCVSGRQCPLPRPGLQRAPQSLKSMRLGSDAVRQPAQRKTWVRRGPSRVEPRARASGGLAHLLLGCKRDARERCHAWRALPVQSRGGPRAEGIEACSPSQPGQGPGTAADCRAEQGQAEPGRGAQRGQAVPSPGEGLLARPRQGEGAGAARLKAARVPSADTGGLAVWKGSCACLTVGRQRRQRPML